MRLSGSHLPPGKFPAAFQMRARQPARHEQRRSSSITAAVDDDRSSRGIERERAGSSCAIGQTRHFGFLATQIMAPKSISAWLKSKTCRAGTSVSETRPEVPFHRVALGIAGADEHAKQHPRDVGVENGGAFAEREAADRAGRVRADTLERQQRCLIAGSRPPYLPPASRAMRLQAFGADVVAERIPGAVTSRSGAWRGRPTTGTCPATRRTSAARDRPASAAA